MAGFGPQPGILGTVNQQHGAYYYPTRRGNQYSASNVAVVATALAAGLTTTYTGGLVLYNPIASTVKLSINFVAASFVLAQTNAAMISLATGFSATVAPTGTLTLVPSVNNLAGSALVAKGLAYSSASITLPVAPVIQRQLYSLDTGALTVTTNDGPPLLELGGGVVLMPGAYAIFASSAAGTAASFFGQYVWEEIPLGG